jgi:hypothetical protein
MALEITEFRDALLRRLGSGGITGRYLLKEVRIARDASTDKAAWAPIYTHVAATDQQVQVGELSAFLLPWLQNLTKDYCEGSRRTDIWTLRDVTGCRLREACLQLGSSHWDIEAALRSYYAGSSGALAADGGEGCAGACANTSSSWSSRGARLRQQEMECPICMEAFEDGEAPVEFKCCFQIMCRKCRSNLVHEGRITCPFCRAVSTARAEDTQPPSPPPASACLPQRRSRRRARSASLERVVRVAERFFEEIIGEAPPRRVVVPAQARPPRPERRRPS